MPSEVSFKKMLLKEIQSKSQKVCVFLVFISSWILPHQGSIDLHGERVVFKRRDLTEDMRQEQIDKGDGDGR